MATGGIFQLITNDGKQDRMLMATKLLNKRLLDIERMRARNPQIKDPTPTLVDIERTHILFMNAHFKPFAAIGYEYNKVRVQSGSAALGQEVQFSIPQFGDFFHDMVLHIRLGQVAADDADDATRFVRYIDRPGQKLVKNVKFTVNGNPLDEYDSDVHNMHEKFFVTPNKQLGWDRCTGQEVAKRGFVNSGSGRGAGVREKIDLCDGPQTPKQVQPAVDMWIPLLFWFNKDPRLAIPSVSIPYGQRFIDVELARARELLQHVGAAEYDDDPGANPPPVPNVEVCELFINNIFVNPEIHDIFIKRIGFSLIRVHRQQTTRTSKHMDRILHQQLKWPIETLYVGLRPVENINENSTKLLESWHIYARTSTDVYQACGLANGFFLSAEPEDLTGANIAAVMVALTGVDLTGLPIPDSPSVDEINDVLREAGLDKFYDPSDFADPNAPTALELFENVPTVYCEARYLSCEPILEKLTVEAHGIPLYRDIPASFFNHYVPYTYGGAHITTPADCGVQMITFNLYPGSYQPSGHVNVSRAREFYLEFQRTQLNGEDDNSQADLVVVAIAINFLLISDGSAVLRYST